MTRTTAIKERGMGHQMRQMFARLEEAASAQRSSRRTNMDDYDWKAIATAMRGHLVQSPEKKQPAVIFVGNKRYEFFDNGGEVHVFLSQPVGDTVPFWSKIHPGGAVGPRTLAYRLAQRIEGAAIDYEKNLDQDGTA